MPNGQQDGLHLYVFLMTILIAKGVSFALAPLYFEYAQLDECTSNISPTVGRYNVVIHVDSNILQVFIYERFPSITPKPTEFPLMVTEEVN